MKTCTFSGLNLSCYWLSAYCLVHCLLLVDISNLTSYYQVFLLKNVGKNLLPNMRRAIMCIVSILFSYIVFLS